MASCLPWEYADAVTLAHAQVTPLFIPSMGLHASNVHESLASSSQRQRKHLNLRSKLDSGEGSAHTEGEDND
jgi:hypothetical protein